MNQLQSALSLLCLLGLLFSACSRDRDSPSKPEVETEATTSNNNRITLDDQELDIDINNLEDLNGVLDQISKKMNDGEEVEAVDFRKLKELLPEKLVGMKRNSLEGEKTGVSVFKFSLAKATYGDGNARMEVSIVDGAGISGIVNGMAAWTMIEVDKETDSGFERTTTINGYKAFESFDAEQQEGQVAIVVEDRFIINIEGDRITSDKTLRRALNSLDLAKLKKII